MAGLLLTTKLYIPRAHTRLVSRPRLVDQLANGLQKSLTLVSAPAGYGKTTLLVDWHFKHGRDYPLAWLSLDSDDNNLARFLTYVAAALETLDPNLTFDLVSQLQLPDLPPMEELIIALINGVNVYPQDFALVLDDCHVITESSIHKALGYLLDHIPQKMHIVMLTRSDPPIHLAKLRARGNMVELRTNDLRFSSEESTIFLNDVMDLKLSGNNVIELDQRTEGWIVGLQMAALTIKGKKDATKFIHAFSGSNRHILDFLSEEVIQQQPKSIQTFLLHTSILDRFTGSLCDAVLDIVNSSDHLLKELERKNLFLIPLDDERQWYRYHHLFSDLLFRHLKQTEPTIVNTLYERAAAWFEQNDFHENAIGYALKAQNYELATRLMLQIKNSLWNRGEVHMLLNWLNTLPEELVQSQPELCIAHGGSLILLGHFDAAEKWLKLVEADIKPTRDYDLPTTILRQKILIYRSVNARFHGDYDTAIDLGQSGLEITPRSEIRDMGSALLFLSHAHYFAGNTEKAEQVLTNTVNTMQAAGHFSACLNARHYLAQLKVLQGHLHEAAYIYNQAIRYARETETPIYSGVEYAGLGDLKREWNQLENAALDIQKGIDLAESGDFIFFLTEVYPVRIHLAISQKDWEAAISFLQKAELVAQRCPTSIEIKHLQAWQARLHLAQGDLSATEPWADSVEAKLKRAEIAAPHDLINEFVLLTLARVWIAGGRTDQAADLLDNVRINAAAAGRTGRALEAHMLQALAEQASGNDIQAINTLSHVLSTAEPEGYIRLFIEEGAAMAKLLYKVTSHATTEKHEYAGRLLAAYSQEQEEKAGLIKRTLPDEKLLEPLSKREIEVLLLMANGCSNKEIASQLVISIGTVKRHVIHIFQKLGATNRTQAVAIGRELEIV
ncbi:MAG: hypothetical protein JSV42_00625 [Chloroflexota bacterium]|nr:MAG: hypothetical protein JSV42_00625 [Chloroflexota bacterium]